MKKNLCEHNELLNDLKKFLEKHDVMLCADTREVKVMGEFETTTQIEIVQNGKKIIAFDTCIMSDYIEVSNEATTDQSDLLLDRRGRGQLIRMISKELNLTEEQVYQLEKVYRTIPYQQLRTKFPEIVPYILRVKEEQEKAASIEYDLPVVRELLANN